MALVEGQTVVQLNKLYQANRDVGLPNIQNQLAANVSVNDGSIDVYGSNSATQPSTLAEMPLNDGDTDLKGINEFNVIPKYVAFVQNTGTTTEIVLNGVRVQELGDIS
jgi:hypothetical protein